MIKNHTNYIVNNIDTNPIYQSIKKYFLKKKKKTFKKYLFSLKLQAATSYFVDMFYFI